MYGQRHCLNDVVGLTYDVKEDRVYWTDFHQGFIRRTFLNGTGLHTLVIYRNGKSVLHSTYWLMKVKSQSSSMKIFTYNLSAGRGVSNVTKWIYGPFTHEIYNAWTIVWTEITKNWHKTHSWAIQFALVHVIADVNTPAKYSTTHYSVKSSHNSSRP